MTRRLYIRSIDPSEKTEDEVLESVQELIETVEFYVPEMKELIRQVDDQETDMILISQDNFAGLYHIDEYTLFGMVMTYIAYHGVNAMVVPTSENM